MPGPLSRQHKHERRYTPGTHSVIPTRRIWNDYGNQMIFGDLCGPKVSWHLSYRWEKPPKNLTQETCPNRGSNLGPLRDRRAWYRLFHSGGHVTHNTWNNFQLIIFTVIYARLLINIWRRISMEQLFNRNSCSYESVQVFACKEAEYNLK